MFIQDVEVFKKSDNSRLLISCGRPCTNSSGARPGNEAAKAFDSDIKTFYQSAGLFPNEDVFIHVNIADVRDKSEISEMKIKVQQIHLFHMAGSTVELLKDGVRVWAGTLGLGDSTATEQYKIGNDEHVVETFTFVVV